MRALLRSRKAVAGLILLGMMLLLALVGPLLAQDPAAFVGRPLDPPSTQHWLGTTGQGQDVLAQTLVGARTTLGLGLVVGVAVVAIGAVVGGMSGLFGRRVDELLSFMQLQDRADALVNQLSGGMKRRLVIARALIGESELVILDEPATGLDPQARVLIWKQLLTLKKMERPCC